MLTWGRLPPTGVNALARTSVGHLVICGDGSLKLENGNILHEDVDKY